MCVGLVTMSEGAKDLKFRGAQYKLRKSGYIYIIVNYYMNKYIFISIPLLSIISLLILSVSHLQCVGLKGVNCNQLRKPPFGQASIGIEK